jgi:dolichol-phosphate mannosyltransferase
MKDAQQHLLQQYVSAVVCARDEEENIVHLLPALRNIVGESVLVDGNSKDRTVEISSPYVDTIVADNGGGKGEAIRIGAENATLPIVVFIDADLSHDPNEIPLLVLPILTGSADMVVGSRGLGGSRELQGTFEQFLRATGSHIILLGINLRFAVHLTDSQNGFRAIRRDLFLRLGLKEPHTTIEQEMEFEVLRRKYIVSEVPTHEYARYAGDSKISLLKHSFRYVTSLVRFMLRRSVPRNRRDRRLDDAWQQTLDDMASEHREALDGLVSDNVSKLTGQNPVLDAG